MVVLVIRTRRPFLKSRPSWQLATTTLAIALVTIALPYTPVGTLFKFVPLPGRFFPVLAVILVAYGASAEFAKRIFYRMHAGT